MRSWQTLIGNLNELGHWMRTGLPQTLKLVLLLCVMLIAACQTPAQPSVSPSTPSSLPTVPPLNADLTRPIQACYLNAMSMYLSGSGSQQMTLCADSNGASSSTTK